MSSGKVSVLNLPLFHKMKNVKKLKICFKKEYSSAILTDLSKTLDMINFEIFIAQHHFYELHQDYLELFES